METAKTPQYSPLGPVVARLERELIRLKALLGWQIAVVRGTEQAKKQRLTPEQVISSLYESRYGTRSRRS